MHYNPDRREQRNESWKKRNEEKKIDQSDISTEELMRLDSLCDMGAKKSVNTNPN